MDHSLFTEVRGRRIPLSPDDGQEPSTDVPEARPIRPLAVRFGYFTLSALHQFYSQFYSNQLDLRKNTSRVFSRLVNASRSSDFQAYVRVRCTACHRPLGEPCSQPQKPKSTHHGGIERLEIATLRLDGLTPEMFQQLDGAGAVATLDYTRLLDVLKL